MAFDLTFSIKVFAALFAIMNPIANIPVFLSLTEGAADGVRRKVALTAAIGVTVGCIVSAVAGGAILHVFGLTVDDFRLAGGLLVLLIALSMLHGAPSRQHSPGDDEGADPAAAESVAIYPLTIPLLVGPGTIATMIVLGHTAFSTGQAFAFALGLAAFLVLLAVSLLSAPLIGHYLSPRVTAVTQRLMGMILAAIAMQMIVASLKAAFGLPH
ncbi:MarC family protein [Burkholderia sp. AU38729]|uniref:MarC family protein n=1 Tax=Burkholderia sp. AU38729 TaxID=2879633 RepID=UPI001CF3C937|nr:NAAT family transporter [Burkholderia sp. AU38729]MCA8067254.1 NAAT family transporter [Burkholderia sp. AU38729]